MQHPNLAKRHLLANEVDVDLDMLGAAMLDWIRGHVYGRNIVTINQSSRTKRSMKLLENLPYPTALGNSMSHSPIFGLCTGP
jgi:hypothetical protein